VSCRCFLERRDKESNLTRAFGVHGADPRAARRPRSRRRAHRHRPAGVATGPFGIKLFGLPSRFPYLLITPQYETERVLEQRAAGARRVDRTRHRAARLRQDADAVD